ESAYVREGSSQDFVYSPINSDFTNNRGLELDVIKYLRFFGVRGNYTFTLSEITTNKLAYFRDENGDLVPNFLITQERPLYGQSRHAGNVSFIYKGLKNKANAQLAFSYTGDRIHTVSQYIDNDEWQKGFWQLDASAQKVFGKKIQVFVKAHNLLNTRLYAYILKTNDYNNIFPNHGSNDENTLVIYQKSAPSFIAGIRITVN
ncbi:MAG: TonB-dependent receptor, partial [Bacteroidales bacterium]|nr:TonB-dependent receptor [Bacteroidales bacterium]